MFRAFARFGGSINYFFLCFYLVLRTKLCVKNYSPNLAKPLLGVRFFKTVVIISSPKIKPQFLPQNFQNILSSACHWFLEISLQY